MTAAQIQRVQELFSELHAMTAAERTMALGTISDAEVRDEVESLLQHTDGPTV